MLRRDPQRSRPRCRCGAASVVFPALLVAMIMVPLVPAIMLPSSSPGCTPGERRQVSLAAICLSNLHQLGRAARQYADDWDGGLPFVSRAEAQGVNNWAGQPGAGRHPIRVEDGTLWSYLRRERVYVCPSDKGVPPGDSRVPTHLYPSGFPLSYSMNYKLNRNRVPYKIDDPVFTRPDLMLLFIHEARSTINDGAFIWDYNWDEPAKSHFDGSNCCFLDGHVEWLRFSVLMNIIYDMPDRTRGPWEWDPQRLWPPEAR